MRTRTARLLVASSCILAGSALLVLSPHVPLDVAPARAAQNYDVRGVVQSIAKDRSSLTIAHEAIPGFMPAMMMSFDARSPDQLAAVKEKDRVAFSFTVTDDGRRLIDSIRPAATSRGCAR